MAEPDEQADHVEVADTAEPPDAEQSGDPGNREAAKWRRKLRAAEAERDQLAARVDGYRRTEVEAIAGTTGMATPADLWALHPDIADLLTDDGEIDAEAVATLVGDVLAERPGWRKAKLDLGQGARNGVPQPASWDMALRQR